MFFFIVLAQGVAPMTKNYRAQHRDMDGAQHPQSGSWLHIIHMHIGDVWSFDARVDLLILSVWHFAILKFICQSLAHSEILLMSFCKISSSSGLVICLYTL